MGFLQGFVSAAFGTPRTSLLLVFSGVAAAWLVSYALLAVGGEDGMQDVWVIAAVFSTVVVVAPFRISTLWNKKMRRTIPIGQWLQKVREVEEVCGFYCFRMLSFSIPFLLETTYFLF